MIYKIYNDGYVAAIITGTKEMADWISRVPDKITKTLKVEMVPFRYPFYLVETETKGRVRAFIPAQNHDDIANIKALIANAPGFMHVTTYTINEDFLGDPKHPGRDYMGALDHIHEGEDEIPD